MQTDIVDAWQVGNGDIITLGSEYTWEVVSTEDSGPSITFVLRDEDGEVDWENPTSFLAYDPITIVTSLEDDE
jgi:hypothetical protein